MDGLDTSGHHQPTRGAQAPLWGWWKSCCFFFVLCSAVPQTKQGLNLVMYSTGPLVAVLSVEMWETKAVVLCGPSGRLVLVLL